jgi:hypothetical protein
VGSPPAVIKRKRKTISILMGLGLMPPIKNAKQIVDETLTLSQAARQLNGVKLRV